MRPRPLQAGTEPPPASPPSAYSATGRRLLLPPALPLAVQRLSAEDPAGPDLGEVSDREFAAFLYGTRGTAGQPDIAHGLVVPDQTRGAKSYSVSSDAVAGAADVTRARRWVTVGQLHSHPARDVEHSWYDDENAISTRVISIVVPGYARGSADPRSWLDVAGVHEFQCGWWHLLTGSARSQRVSFADLPLKVIDLRLPRPRETR
jgi:hypothetical protein